MVFRIRIKSYLFPNILSLTQSLSRMTKDFKKNLLYTANNFIKNSVA